MVCKNFRNMKNRRGAHYLRMRFAPVYPTLVFKSIGGVLLRCPQEQGVEMQNLEKEKLLGDLYPSGSW